MKYLEKHAGLLVGLLILLCFICGSINLFPVAIAKSLEKDSSQQNQSTAPEINIEPGQPQQLFFEALLLKKEGKLAQALVKLSEAYGEENILTDGYYDLVDKERTAILRNIANGASWSKGAPDRTDTLYSFQHQFDKIRSLPDRFTQRMSNEKDLPYERFLNFEIIQMEQKKDIQILLDSPDPWVISTVLFLARKDQLTINPVRLIKRWERRPDLWDTITDDQVLLYLATLKPVILKTLKLPQEIAEKFKAILGNKKPSNEKSATVTPKFILSHNGKEISLSKVTLIRLSQHKREGTMQRWTGDTAFQYSYKEISREDIILKDLKEKTITLEPGYYQFKYNDVSGVPPSGYYGDSNVFEVKTGDALTISLMINAAI